jgi:CRP-like cAMP-binding protein
MDSAISTNRLLASLPPKEYKRLLPSLQPVELKYSAVIYDYGAAISHVYFPESGIISLLSSVEERSLLEIGIVGNEGMVGLPLFLGVRTSRGKAVVQGGGTAFQVTAAAFMAECELGGKLSHVLRRFTHSLMSQISQSAVCFRFHPAEQRLSRWLLMTGDRMGSDELQITQSFLSNMLGVRREAVNIAVSALEKRNLIRHGRGSISIIDRAQLEKASCKCYAIIRGEETDIN